jgi:hypothetical protein
MDNYFLAADRLYEDSSILNNNNRWFSACYLAGYVLECYCKVILIVYNLKTYEDLKIKYGHDLAKLNEEIRNSISKLPPSAKYIIDLKIECPNIYSGAQKWNPVKRYCCDKGFWDDSFITKNFIDEATKVMKILRLMKFDGVIK